MASMPALVLVGHVDLGNSHSACKLELPLPQQFAIETRTFFWLMNLNQHGGPRRSFIHGQYLAVR